MTKRETILRKIVLENSVSQVWEVAVREWNLIDMTEDEGCQGHCICTKTGLRYLYTIQNFRNEKKLEYIGSSCIQLFEDDEMVKTCKILETWGDRKITTGRYEGQTFKEAMKAPGINGYYQALTGKYAPKKKCLCDFIIFYELMRTMTQ